MEVLDPVVLGADEAGCPCGRLPRGDVARGGAGCREIAQKPVVVTSFLHGVPVQVIRKRPGERVVGPKRTTAPRGQFHQGH